MHRLRFAKAHLDLGRMDVDVDRLGRHGQEQRIARMALVVQHVAVGFAQRVLDQLIADEAAVDEEILAVAAGFALGRRAGQTKQAQAAAAKDPVQPACENLSKG